MFFKSFSDLIASVENGPKRTVVLAAAQDSHALEAVVAAHKDGKIDYLLVGDASRILDVADKNALVVDRNSIVEAATDEASAELAVKLVKETSGRFLMKGGLMTATLLKAVVNKETGIRAGGVISHLALIESPDYHKLIAVSDGGMIPNPDLDQKRAITQNAVGFFKRLGYVNPKVAFLTAVEVVNPKMPETEEAATLAAEVNNSGEALAAGPISLDLAVNRESADIKMVTGPVVADADIMIVPNIVAGNVLSKGMLYFGRAMMAGTILGAKVPIVLTSRGASAKEKYLSLLIAAAASQ